jgi:hypothetical protein
MAQAMVDDVFEVEQRRPAGVRKASLKANWRILALTLYMGISLFEYGFDKGAIAGFQAMPGFLHVFGYQSKPGAWNIRVCLSTDPRRASQSLANHCSMTPVARSPADYLVIHDPRRLHRLAGMRTYRRKSV